MPFFSPTILRLLAICQTCSEVYTDCAGRSFEVVSHWCLVAAILALTLLSDRPALRHMLVCRVCFEVATCRRFDPGTLRVSPLSDRPALRHMLVCRVFFEVATCRRFDPGTLRVSPLGLPNGCEAVV